jgi:hypothetical protein
MYVTSIGVNAITKGTEKQQPFAGSIFSLSIPGVQGVEFPFYN